LKGTALQGTDQKMQLFQVNRGKFISTNEEYRIDYVPYSGGSSEWIISRKNSTDAYFTALTSASTLADAKAKYFEIVKAVA
jgi:hypothetical protein